MRMRTLRTGAEVPEMTIRPIYMAMASLFGNDVSAVHVIAGLELVALARDPGHELFGVAGEVLESMGLVDESHQMHESIRCVVLASIEGEGSDVHVVSPVG
ncbi:hypothetical protein ABT282_08255 [Streptomyces sp. NPDC000927]|uniref:hypothetical protein n=1 Tax=Streptomyces sp. NPDC000927 TaxID=3154371 RepID=UPI00331F6585